MVIAAILDAAASVAKLAHGNAINDSTVVSCMSIGIDLAIIGHVVMSQRVRDTFADFPLTAAP